MVLVPRADGVAAGRWVRGAMVQAVAVLALMGCSTLPISGPTGNQVIKQSNADRGALKFKLVEVTDFSLLPEAPAIVPMARQDAPPPPTDLIGPDDVLDIEIYEAGVTLFAGSNAHSSSGDTASAGNMSGAQAERMPAVRVDDSGFIRLPYAGRLRAAGHTPGELAAMIRTSLHGLSQNPQVIVSIQQSINNSVIIGGEVSKPGRLVLSTNRELLSDAVALAGGYHGDAKDLSVRVTRGTRAFEYRLADVLSGPDRDMMVAPGDRIALLRAPLTFAVMGGSGKVEQVPFSAAAVSLAEAVAAGGGASPYFGDAKAVFVFRFVQGEDGHEIPVVYHLNMMTPGSYFLSQRFAMRDKDLLYIGNAASNQPSKLIQLVSQLFSPVVAVETGVIGTGLGK